MADSSSRNMLLWSGHNRGQRLADRHGLLPLRESAGVIRARRSVPSPCGSRRTSGSPGGAEFLSRFKSSEISDRRYCTKCGSHLIVDHPTLGLTDIRAVLPTLAFRPTVHLNYEESVLPIKDGLPKLKDFPAAIGGSGETLPE